MKQYTVQGMSCAACASKVEKSVSNVAGVQSCAVNLLTNSMSVTGDAPPEQIIAAVEKAGYTATAMHRKRSIRQADTALKDTETPKIKKRLIASIIILLPLMYLSMGHMMFNIPLPNAMHNNHIAMGLAQMLLAGIIMVINQKFFISGWRGLLHKAPNMDTLVALGAGASFLYSTYALFAMTSAQLNGNHTAVMAYMEHFYFESAAMILTLITVGKMLEAYSKGKTTNALKELLRLTPQTATLIQNGKELSVPADNVQIGDTFIVKSGESIPVDGKIIEGTAAIDESALTGESIPVDKTAGDTVSAATINTAGYLTCEATHVGENTLLAQIIQMVSDAAATKAPIAKIADKVSGVFVPIVMGIACLTGLIWLLNGKPFAFALTRSIAVLVISCPCALGLATPVAIMVGNGRGAKNGILFKHAAALEETGKTQIVVLDKTGTVTQGTPTVTDIHPFDITESALLSRAYALEQKSEHPLANAIVAHAKEKDAVAVAGDNFRVYAGNGVSAIINGKEIAGGNRNFIAQKATLPPEADALANALSHAGKTPVFFAENQKCIGIIALADTVKDDSRTAIKTLQNMGIRVVLLTGDNRRTAHAIGTQIGIDTIFAEVLPQDKERTIRALQAYGKVAMVGDGINDAPALTRADIGIAMRSGTDIAADAADIVLMNSHVADIPAAIRLSRAARQNIYENLFWAFIYNLIGIPLAAGVLLPFTQQTISPMFAAVAMSLSSVCVVTNALRLNLFNTYRVKQNRIKTPVVLPPASEILQEEKNMTKTITIEGMMCAHCEAAVKKALENIEGVTVINISHETGKATVSLAYDTEDDTLCNAITALDYKVIQIK